MSYFYKQQFVSPVGLFALVKEELKGYFDTGSVDDVLFGKWTMQCLRKLGKASYPINEAMMCINNFESRLPDDFKYEREIWACTDYGKSYQAPSAVYSEVKEISTKLSSNESDLVCNSCATCTLPDVIQAVYKTTFTVAFEWRKEYLLKPGNIYPSCPEDLYCANYNSVSTDTYDIRDNKIKTSFRDGKVYMQYYSDFEICNNLMIPDEYYQQKFIELFLKEKIFEQLSNQATDDGMKAMQSKYTYYKQLADEAYILADSNNKKEDVYRKQRAIQRTQNRLRNYNIK